jgi:GntR family transcriptional regulator/MocR family aminotransferase
MTIIVVAMKRVAPGILPVVAVDRGARLPLHRQLYEGYREAIVERRLRAGQRLPSTRALAAELGISRIPVLNAFEQLLAEGYFESRVGAGTFVARALPDDLARPRSAAELLGSARSAHQNARTAGVRPSPPAPGKRPVARAPDVLLSLPPEPWIQGDGAFRLVESAVDHFPMQVWSTLVARHGRDPRYGLLRYGDPMGYRPFREALAAYLRTARAVRCEADQIMVVSGSQQALELSARVLLDPGSPVWVEEPGYPGVHNVLRMAGAKIVPVPVDGEGLDVAAGAALAPQARAAYVTPSHQYPLGVTMSASRRLQLLDWARHAGTWILEDDYDSEYRYESLPISALQGLDRDARVIYIGTFSKVLFPALRIGYLVLPPDLVPRFAAVREAMDIFPPTLYQAVLTEFVDEGHFGRHLRRMRLLYRERRDALVAALQEELGGELEVQGGQAGLHLAATFTSERAPGRTDVDIALEAAKRKLWVVPLSITYLGAEARQGLILGYGGLDAEQIRDGARRLREVVRAK